jgi:hypothetical protein
MSNDQQKPEVEQTTEMPPYKYCLNCNTELNGNYCHNCGQQATSPTPSIGSFLVEYLSNAFMWDNKLFKTLWYLLSQPGRLTSDFIAGKFIAHMNPLKLNMFMLFVTITVFVFIAGSNNIDETVQNITSDEQLGASFQLEILTSDAEYLAKMNQSPRDTIELYAPLMIATEYQQVITNIETIEDTQGKGVDRWRAVVPHTLIEDSVLVVGENNCYNFNNESTVTTDTMNVILDVLGSLKDFITKYFPLIVLLTTPLLSLSLSIIQHNRRLPGINHFIFSLHYTTFLAVLIMFIYVLYLTISPSLNTLEWIIIIASSAYLTIAIRRVYGSANWLRAVIKAVLVNVTYLVICLLMFTIAFFIACISVAISLI